MFKDKDSTLRAILKYKYLQAFLVIQNKCNNLIKFVLEVFGKY